MTKLYRLPVKVELNAHDCPKRFRWFGMWHRVLSYTICGDERPWWRRLREPEPTRYRCETDRGLVCELYFEDELGTWVLERVWD